jgi:hypothetical protein
MDGENALHNYPEVCKGCLAKNTLVPSGDRYSPEVCQVVPTCRCSKCGTIWEQRDIGGTKGAGWFIPNRENTA